MEDYQIETIELLRAHDARFEFVTDQQIVETYKEWSDIYHAAGWISITSKSVKSFADWAFSAPIDRV